jgi:hypothetical protein
LELAILRHRILVFFAEIASLNQNVDARRKAPVLELVKADGSRVLLASEHQLQFLLPLCLKPPGGERSRHQDGHHAKRDEQSCHRVAAISVLTP